MFGFTRKTDYALVALAALAEEAAGAAGTPGNGRGGAHAEGPGNGHGEGSGPTLSARSISERYGVPRPLMMNVLKDLVGGGLVRSTRGAKGGYSLARPASGISVHDVVSAIEGPVSVTVCCDPAEADPCQECGVEVRCPITHSVRRLNDRIQDYLRAITLEHLLSTAGDAIVPVSHLVPVHSIRTRENADR